MARKLRRLAGLLMGCALSFALQGAAVAQAGTRTVPTEFPTIAEAVAASLDGDTIRIEPGTYAEHLTLANRTLTFEGAGGPDVTILDGGGSGTIFTINGGTYVMRGLTLAHGNSGGTWGGAINIDSNNGPGGNLSLEDCTIRDSQGTYGGGIALFARYAPISVTARNCLFLNNRSDYGGGGAVYAGWLSNFSCESCRFEWNSAAYVGGAIYGSFGFATVTDSALVGNSAAGSGGAVIASGWGSVYLERCVLSGNGAGGSGGAGHATGGMYGPAVIARNSLLFGNAAAAGGALSVESGGRIEAVFSTIADNTAATGGGIYAAEGVLAVVRDSIIYRNSSLSVLPAGTVSFSDVEGGFEGPGNIDLDPLFTNPAAGDYTLALHSPCVDAADPADQGLDLAGTARPLGPAPDMGAYERILDGDGDGFPSYDDCNDGDASIFPGAAEIPFDGVDQDCNGLDLTIRIRQATWSKSRKELAVEATSRYQAQALLQLSSHGVAMRWNARNQIWAVKVTDVRSLPQQVTVSGAEGGVSGPVSEVR